MLQVNSLFLNKLKMSALVAFMSVGFSALAEESTLSIQERIEFLQQNADRSPFYFKQQGDQSERTGVAVRSRGCRVQFDFSKPNDGEGAGHCTFSEAVELEEWVDVMFVVPDCVAEYLSVFRDGELQKPSFKETQWFDDLTTTMETLVRLEDNEVVTTGDLVHPLLSYGRRDRGKYPLWFVHDKDHINFFITGSKELSGDNPPFYLLDIAYVPDVGLLCRFDARGVKLAYEPAGRTMSYVDRGCGGNLFMYRAYPQTGDFSSDGEMVQATGQAERKFRALTGPIYDYYVTILDRQRAFE